MVLNVFDNLDPLVVFFYIMLKKKQISLTTDSIQAIACENVFEKLFSSVS